MPNTSPPTEQDHPSKKRRGRTRRGRRGGRKSRRSEPSEDSRERSDTAVSPELDIGIVFAERSELPARPALLDAAAARRLAADARRREQASREALEATRSALRGEVERYASLTAQTPSDANARLAEPAQGSPPIENDATEAHSDTLPEPNPEPRASAPRVESSGWQRVPLQPKVSVEEPIAKASPEAQPAPGPVERAEAAATRDAAAEARIDVQTTETRNLELESTLTIARETAIAQRTELAELRDGLASRDLQIAALEAALQGSTNSVEEERVAMRAALEAAQREIEALRERVMHEERAQKTREAERLLLEQKLEAQESALAERMSQIQELRDRLEAQDEAMHAARREYELERTRHSESLHILNTLRSMLTERPATDAPDRRESTDDLAGSPGPTRPEREHLHDAAPSAITFVSPESGPTLKDYAPSEPEPTQAAATPATRDETQTDARTEAMLPPIFDAWQDDQIRRQFGPMGIESFADLLRVPLARSEGARSSEQAILLIGRGAAEAAGAIAESLVRSEIGAFQIHVADPRGEDALETGGLWSDSPLREFVTPVAFPRDPQALEATLERLRPRAIVSRDFLTREADVAPWLACFERATARGASLVLSEGTGTAAVTPPAEVAQVGERIWELMPERYTREAGSNRRIEHWSEAFDAREVARPNELVAGLRERFSLEMFTQFGFLAEPFLASSVGWNFDPEAPRDRRFLGQVADLDDRRIEAGLVPALHLVALVDPLASD